MIMAQLFSKSLLILPFILLLCMTKTQTNILILISKLVRILHPKSLLGRQDQMHCVCDLMITVICIILFIVTMVTVHQQERGSNSYRINQNNVRKRIINQNPVCLETAVHHGDQYIITMVTDLVNISFQPQLNLQK